MKSFLRCLQIVINFFTDLSKVFVSGILKTDFLIMKIKSEEPANDSF